MLQNGAFPHPSGGRKAIRRPSGVAVIAEPEKDGVSVAELLSVAGQIRSPGDDPVQVLLLGNDIADLSKDLANRYGVDVTAISGDGLAVYSAETWLSILPPLLNDMNPRFICTGHTSRGADFAPALAVHLGAACITNVIAIRKREFPSPFDRAGRDPADPLASFSSTDPPHGVEETRSADGHAVPDRECQPSGTGPAGHSPIVFVRHLCRETLACTIAPLAEMTVLTVQSGAFPASGEVTPPPGRVTFLSGGASPKKTRPLGQPADAAEAAADLAQADVVVAAGRGMGTADNLTLVRDLTSCFRRSARGASRWICDAGWMEHGRQIGLTGRTVTPRLYIACGISGASQHVAGMKGSACIVAVNRDPRAPIFRIAHYGIVEDVSAFLPVLTSLLRARSHSHRQSAEAGGPAAAKVPGTTEAPRSGGVNGDDKSAKRPDSPKSAD